MIAKDIFIGPIVRWAHTYGITIEIALFKHYNIKFSIRKWGETNWIGEDPLPKNIEVSSKLFFYYANIRPLEGQSFPVNTLLEYSIAILDENGENEDYKLFENIVTEDVLHYPGFALPSLYLQEPSKPLNVLYGSCRKIHDEHESKIDALSLGDNAIKTVATKPDKRPTLLCLGGDQIYADDVDDNVLNECGLLSHRMDLNTEKLRGNLSLPGKGKRQDFLKSQAKFTSDEAKNHLITFGEYMAMYGLMWNVRNWPAGATYLKHFTDTLPAVRRLMANIPTYMLFDDHDVTDDWNISLRWMQDVNSKPLGRQILSNALCAFFLCQGYGNNPADYSDADFYDIAAVITERNKSTADFEKLFIGLKRWEFYTPTYPFIYFLDTRTQRGHKDMKQMNIEAPAFLKSLPSWRATLKKLHLLLRNQKANLPLVLVSPAPIFGFSVVEDLQKTVSAVKGPYFLDFESWGANKDHLLTFATLMGDLNIVLLSGDVHYAYSSTVRYTTFDDPVYRQIAKLHSSANTPTSKGVNPTYNKVFDAKFLQLTSSALKNYANNIAVKIPANWSPSNGIYLTETGWQKGSYTDGRYTLYKEPTKVDGSIEKEVAAQDLKPACHIQQKINDALNSKYLSDHNLGQMTIRNLEITNCFLTKNGKVSERTWNFSNDIYWK